jgi:colanic acid/amylovoran biosynthesis protein
MFGQGIGPLTNPRLRRFAGRVMSELDLLTLREGAYSGPFLSSTGVLPPERGRLTVGAPVLTLTGTPVWLTGDDALVSQAPGSVVAGEDSHAYLGVNVRISSYSGVNDRIGPVFADALWSAAAEHGAGLLALPVSNYPEDADLPAIRRALGPTPREGVPFVGTPATSPATLMRAAERCRAVVTGSYHAAVFALGRGVPVVALSASDYYDVKFDGLRDLYPGLVETVRLDDTLTAQALRDAVARAYATDDAARRDGRHRTLAMVQAAEDAFDAFADHVDSTLGAGALR